MAQIMTLEKILKFPRHKITEEIKKKNRRPPETDEVTKPLEVKKYDKKPKQFEAEVFNFLLRKKSGLGISKIYKLKNLLIDGAIKLSNGKTVLLEIKYRLGWMKSCNAMIQMQRFMLEKRYDESEIKKVSAGVIIFNQFSADWEKHWKKQSNCGEKGWYLFYEEQEAFKDFTTHILQLKMENNELINPILMRQGV